MTEEERQKLADHRRKVQQEKAFHHDVARKLEFKERQNEHKKETSTLTTSLLIFLGTLLPLYIFIYIPYSIFDFLYASTLQRVGIHIGVLEPILHVTFWIAAAASVHLRKSLLDSFFDYLSYVNI